MAICSLLTHAALASQAGLYRYLRTTGLFAKGWTGRVMVRPGGVSHGRCDAHYMPPALPGIKPSWLRNRKQLQEYLVSQCMLHMHSKACMARRTLGASQQGGMHVGMAADWPAGRLTASCYCQLRHC